MVKKGKYRKLDRNYKILKIPIERRFLFQVQILLHLPLFSLSSGLERGQCTLVFLTTFNPDETPEVEKPVKVALGFATLTAKDNFFAEMAERMAGLFPRSKNDKCMKGNYGKKFTRGVDHFSLTPASTFTEFKKGCLKNPL